MDWFTKLSKETRRTLIGLAIAILAAFGIVATFEVEDEAPPAIEETVSDVEVGEITIVEPEE